MDCTQFSHSSLSSNKGEVLVSMGEYGQEVKKLKLFLLHLLLFDQSSYPTRTVCTETVLFFQTIKISKPEQYFKAVQTCGTFLSLFTR